MPAIPAALPSTRAAATVLAVEHLTTTFDVEGRAFAAVNDVSFVVRRGETLGLVGESGSGKSLTALSVMRLVPPPGRISGGRIVFEDRDLLALGERDMRRVRGGRIGLVLQDPSTALNPVLTVGHQIEEALVVHGMTDWHGARARSVDLLRTVSVPDPDRLARAYPHELSGGLRQRALLAIALACRPVLLIADEATTALDVTIQAEILELLRDLKRSYDLALLLITHDLGVVAQTADRVAVMYAGRIAEEAPVRELFTAPRHPYTQALLASMPGGPAGSRLRPIEGAVPPPDAIRAGCVFAPRCPARLERCGRDRPPEITVAPGHHAHCWLLADDAPGGPGDRPIP